LVGWTARESDSAGFFGRKTWVVALVPNLAGEMVLCRGKCFYKGSGLAGQAKTMLAQNSKAAGLLAKKG